MPKLYFDIPKTIPIQSYQFFTSNSDTDLIVKIKFLRANSKWSDLFKLIYHRDPINISDIKDQGWERPPKTIGCLAIAYLAEGALEESNKIQYYIKGVIGAIVTNLYSPDETLQEFSLKLLNRTLKNATESTIYEILNFNVYKPLFALFPSPILGDLAMDTCKIILYRREKAQKVFFKFKGDGELLKFLELNTVNATFLMSCINALIIDPNGKPNYGNLNKLIDAGIVEAIKNNKPILNLCYNKKAEIDELSFLMWLSLK
ncbi:unnamed protein product [Blepharisma stoltei]|uniref:Uncharacterized protein n=1 Tax=Blepharisma stoltei TaxID=1481888 RepID=A0AAU9JGZ9_9CILI|nr:unnamed protein product [Blepharisma stoltei]